MALPQDFWQNEHMFHRFRSKPCQRLLRSGICEWHSQCQFSHDPDWPRRPPSKHNYSPALCPHLRPVMSSSGEVQLENTCPSGLSCTYSHTKDELLYHPSMFKTSLCEEHRALTSDQRSARRSKHRPRCHRYYCPFAHGKQELRTSPMSPEQREALVRSIGIFPHAVCCAICTHNQIGPVCLEGSSGMSYSNNGYGNSMPMGSEASLAPSLWPGSAQSMLSQMVLPGGNSENVPSEITDGHVWGASPWLQQPLQQQPVAQQPLQQQAVNLSAAVKAMDNTAALKEQMHIQQEVDADDGEEANEIFERAVRFLDEISTEESGEEDQNIPVAKENALQATPVKELAAGSINPNMWNPQEAWVCDASGQGQWQDPGFNYWTMRSVDRIA